MTLVTGIPTLAHLRIRALFKSLDIPCKKDLLHLDSLWIKSFCSFVKTKVRKGQASTESWPNRGCENIYIKPRSN